MNNIKTTGLKPVRTYERASLHSDVLPAVGDNKLPKAKDKLRIIPFGGVEEVGINMTAYEYGDDIIVVDMGLGFPPNNIKGVNYIFPNYRWLEENKERIRAILVTHAHLDHIGAIPYILPRIGNPPIYSLALSIGFIKQRLSEFNLEGQAQLNIVAPDDKLRLGNFVVEFFRVNHNIPDSMGLSISSPAGRVIHTGDWKLDFTPGDQRPAEMDKLARWSGAGKGVLALLSDSTSAERPGYCASEAELELTLDRAIAESKGRVLFSSNALIITRIQQVMNIAAKHNRKVAISGRSMQNNIETALSLGYLKIQPKIIIPLPQVKQLPDNQVLILTTGAQGEDNAHLFRIASDEHRDITLRKSDTVIISSTPIPGNEGKIDTLLSKLTEQGVTVHNYKIMDIHISGHAKQEELKMMIQLTKPKYLIPIHGEHHMLTAHKNLAVSIGMAEENVFIPFDGMVFEFGLDGSAKVRPEKLDSGYVYADETAIGYIDPSLFCEKEDMATAGVVSVIATVNKDTNKLLKLPEVVTRGFTYNKSASSLMKELQYETQKHCEQFLKKSPQHYKDLEIELKQLIEQYIFKCTQRKPLVLPVVIDV